MTEPIFLVLPLPPGVNNLYFTVMKNGRPIRVPSSDLKKFKATVARMCTQLAIKPFLGEVEVTLNIYRPRRVGDTDGYLKSSIDSLSGFAYQDDKQVKRIIAERFEDPARPRVEITVSPLGLC
jgi:Holliday junction resolvase RusA-like endonuclease